MRRGVVAALAGVTAVFALVVAAMWFNHWRSHSRVVTIAIIQYGAVDNQTVEGFKAGLADAGFRDGDNLVLIHDGPAGGPDRLAAMIARALESSPDLIMVTSTPATRAVMDATRSSTIPIIFAPVNDPVAAGIVGELAHPGGHVTGVRLPLGDDLRLYWLKRIAPRTRAVLLPYAPSDRSALATVSAVSAVAPLLGLDMRLAPVGSCAEVDAVLAKNAAAVQAVFLPRDSLVESCIDGIVATARALRLPVVAPSVTQVRQGAVFSYGFVHHQIGRQAGRLAVQVLGGVAPGDLPVEAAESHLAVNPKAAAAIGLDVADDVLAQADIIERD